MSVESAPPEIKPWPTSAADQATLLQRAAGILEHGGLVVFPTDTVYGIAADPFNQAAVEQIFVVKRRPAEKRIALLVNGDTDLRRLAQHVPPAAEALARAAWPGALTIVLASAVTDLGPTVALRWPDHEVPTRLIEACGFPLATTSANISSAPSPRTAQDVLDQLTSGYALLIDGGPAPGGVDSTVIDFSTEEPRLLRRGALAREVMEAALGADAAERLLQDSQRDEDG